MTKSANILSAAASLWFSVPSQWLSVSLRDVAHLGHREPQRILENHREIDNAYAKLFHFARNDRHANGSN